MIFPARNQPRARCLDFPDFTHLSYLSLHLQLQFTTLAGSNDKSVIVVGFDADNCISSTADREFSFHKGTVRDIHFHDDNTMLSVGGGDNLLHLSDVEKGKA